MNEEFEFIMMTNSCESYLQKYGKLTDAKVSFGDPSLLYLNPGAPVRPGPMSTVPGHAHYPVSYVEGQIDRYLKKLDKLSPEEKAKLADFLEAAVDVLDRDGWCKHQLHTKSTRVVRKEDAK